MAINFKLQKVIKEAAEADKLCGGECELDQILTDTDLNKIMEDISPITGEVAGKLQEQMADPMNLRIVQDESTDQFYMDYNELVNYCEATGLGIVEAVKSIFEAYHENYNMCVENFNIVFPDKKVFTEAVAGNVGYQDIAWSSHLMGDCKNNGLRCTTFVDPGIGKASVELPDAPKGEDHTEDEDFTESSFYNDAEIEVHLELFSNKISKDKTEEFIGKKISSLVSKWEKAEVKSTVSDAAYSVKIFVTVEGKRISCEDMVDNGTIKEKDLDTVSKAIATHIRSLPDYNKGKINKSNFTLTR